MSTAVTPGIPLAGIKKNCKGKEESCRRHCLHAKHLLFLQKKTLTCTHIGPINQLTFFSFHKMEPTLVVHGEGI